MRDILHLKTKCVFALASALERCQNAQAQLFPLYKVKVKQNSMVAFCKTFSPCIFFFFCFAS